MLVFYLISLPLTMGMVILTLKYFAGPDVPTYVFFTVGYTWFCSFSIIILVPADIWTVISLLQPIILSGNSFYHTFCYLDYPFFFSSFQLLIGFKVVKFIC